MKSKEDEDLPEGKEKCYECGHEEEVEDLRSESTGHLFCSSCYYGRNCL